MPEFFNKPNCLGVGETGLHKSTPNEIESLQAHVDMAMKHGQLVLIHTPHLADKAHGTKTVLEVLAGMGDPNRIWIDHVEEQTIESVLDAGYWAGMTLYPVTKCSPRRAVDIFGKVPDRAIAREFIRRLGTERPLYLAGVDRRVQTSRTQPSGSD